MASEIQIQGPLKFIGYEQDNKAGLNGQFLAYRNGKAIWEDVGDIDKIVYAGSNRIPIMDNDGNAIDSTLEYSGIDTLPREAIASVASTSILGRLEVNVINDSGADLQQYSAYSLEDNAYTLENNTVTLTSSRTGIPTQGQTALFFCQDAIPNGTTGIGVIKGLITTTVLTSVDQERDLKVLPSGGLSDIILEGEYVVGTVTRSPLADSPLEIAFDGLSNYKFVIDSGTTYVFENEQIPLLAQTNVTKINYKGIGVSAEVDTLDNATVNITIPGVTGTRTRVVTSDLLEVTNSSSISLPRTLIETSSSIERVIEATPVTSDDDAQGIVVEDNLLYYVSNISGNTNTGSYRVRSLNTVTNAVSTIFTPTGTGTTNRVRTNFIKVGNKFIFGVIADSNYAIRSYDINTATETTLLSSSNLETLTTETSDSFLIIDRVGSNNLLRRYTISTATITTVANLDSLGHEYRVSLLEGNEFYYVRDLNGGGDEIRKINIDSLATSLVLNLSSISLPSGYASGNRVASSALSFEDSTLYFGMYTNVSSLITQGFFSYNELTSTLVEIERLATNDVPTVDFPGDPVGNDKVN